MPRCRHVADQDFLDVEDAAAQWQMHPPGKREAVRIGLEDDGVDVRLAQDVAAAVRDEGDGHSLRGKPEGSPTIRC